MSDVVYKPRNPIPRLIPRTRFALSRKWWCEDEDARKLEQLVGIADKLIGDSGPANPDEIETYRQHVLTYRRLRKQLE